jgi:beta-alanine degradation protein BauB
MKTSLSSTLQIFKDAGQLKIYKVLFENDKVRVLEGTIRPREKVEMHTHPDHSIYFFESCRLRFTYPDGTTKDASFKKGENVWLDGESHAGENIGNTDIHILVTEIKETWGR